MAKKVNFGNVADDYAKYRDDIPNIIFEQLNEKHINFFGKDVLDLGSGTGIFTRAIFGQRAKVVGVEPERKLINQAVKMDKSVGANIQYICSTAEDLNIPNSSYDIVTALRAWHWFDRNLVNQQVLKVLKSGGFLIVIHSIFVSQNSSEAQETIKAISEFIDLKPAGSMGETQERRTGLPSNWFDEWDQVGFEIVDEWQYDYALKFSKKEWLGKVRSLSWLTNLREEKKQLILAKTSDYLKEFRDPMHIPHRYSVAVLRKTATSPHILLSNSTFRLNDQPKECSRCHK